MAVNDSPAFTLCCNSLIVEEDFQEQKINIVSKYIPTDETEQEIVYSLQPDPSEISWADISIDSHTGEITFKSILNEFGSMNFIMVTDDSQSINNEFMQNLKFIVNEVNDPPLFSLSEYNIILEEDFLDTTKIIVSPESVPEDEIAQTVIYSLSPSSIDWANIGINSVTGEISIQSQENGNGVQIFKVIANDYQTENNIASQSFVLTINELNDPPYFTLAYAQVVLEEDFTEEKNNYVIQDAIQLAETGQTVTYSITPTNTQLANIVIDEDTGKISITSLENANGSMSYTVIADDHQSQKNIYKQSFTLNIARVNDSPEFSFSEDEIILEEDFSEPYLLTITMDNLPDDEKDQEISFIIFPSSVDFADISFDKEKYLITITPVENSSGSEEFTVFADDRQEHNNYFVGYFSLAVEALNDPPAFTLSENNVIADEDFTGTYKIPIIPEEVPEDEVSQTVTYSIEPSVGTCANVIVRLDSYKEIQITSIKDVNCTQVFSVTAQEVRQLTNASFAQDLTVTINPVNDPPSFSLDFYSLSLGEDFQGTKKIHITSDYNEYESNEKYTYSVNSTADWVNVSVNNETEEIEITSVKDGFGQASFVITADDGSSYSNTSQLTFIIEVVEENDPPVFVLNTNELVLEENFSGTQSISLTQLQPENESGQSIFYYMQPLTVSWADIDFDSSTGQIDISNVLNASGSSSFTLTANDGQWSNNTYYQNFSITVNPVNDPPVATDNFYYIFENSILNDMLIGNDPDSDEITFEISKNPEKGQIYLTDDNTGAFTYEPLENANGFDYFQFTVSDKSLVSNTATVSIELTPVYYPPILTCSDDISIDIETAIAHASLTIVDSDAKMATITITSSNTDLIDPDKIIISQTGSNTTNLNLLSQQPVKLAFTLEPEESQTGSSLIEILAQDNMGFTSTVSFTLSVKEVNPIFVNFIASSDRKGLAPLTVSFIAQVQGTVNSLLWDFGDGSTSTETNPDHEYSDPGIYSVKLTAYGLGSPNIREKTNYIEIYGRTITGKVIAQDTGSGLEDYNVTVWKTEHISLNGTSTDANGNYTITDIQVSDFLTISVCPPLDSNEYFSQYYNNKNTWEEADILSTINGDLSNIDFTLKRVPETAISGIVYLKNDQLQKLEKIQVDAFSQKTYFGKSTTTNENGIYTFTGLKDSDDYRISVWYEAYGKEFYYSIPTNKTPGIYIPDYSALTWDEATLVEPVNPVLNNINLIINLNSTIDTDSDLYKLIQILKITAGFDIDELEADVDLNDDGEINLEDAIILLIETSGLFQ